MLPFLLLLWLFVTHLYFTFRLHFIQKKIPEGIALSFGKGNKNKKKEGGISAYEALATALAATMGTGNIIGISAAIAVGGVGAVFWCWVTGVFGIATCYAECFLSSKYRVRKEDGTFAGGPMYVLERVLKKKKMALFFACAMMAASFGVGSSVQSHAICGAVLRTIEISPHLVGIGVAFLTGCVILGGGKQIAKVCMYLVPVMSLLYVAGCAILMIKNSAYLLQTLQVIVRAAFTGRAVTGGIAGRALMVGIRTGISKGLFTNEAGMGSMAVSAADAETVSPVQQGLVSMTGVFWDTVVMCAVTGITLVSCILKEPARFAGLVEDALCFEAFSMLPVPVFSGGNVVFSGETLLSVSLILFAFATIVGWSYYGGKASVYLWGNSRTTLYQLFYIVSVYLGAVMSMETVWRIADVLNLLMAVPNLYSLWCLRKEIIKDTREEMKGRTK